jgi:hypothetical protein
MAKQPLGAMSKLLLKPADISEFIEAIPNVLPLAKKNIMKRQEQTKPNALDEDQYEVQRSEDDDEDHEVLQLNVKFASLREQARFYDDIPDDEPIDCHDVEVGQGSPEELADAIEGFHTSAEQALDDVQSLRQLVTECKDVFRLKLGSYPPANVKPLVINLRRCRARANVSSQVRSAAGEVYARQETRARRAGLGIQEHGSRVGESSARPYEVRARPVSHDCRSACTERVDEADSMAYA